ncbi:hypothetical protein QM012_002900 [Aureobasidium pullulans]|uniref:DUF1365-domain-containing protein n=1 Tax=Aureobasidium pullulans TaxID=5580 RepID=A0ABR0TBF5_AURPU
MMVLEVNNTFGERRLYLLKAEEKATDDSVPDGFEAPAKATKFTNSWSKDFHVSPFNSRKGTYSLTAADPVAALRSGSKVLDNLVVLNSSQAHAKLVARVYSDDDHMEPTTMSISQTIKMLASWFWVGFLTFPRILTQAYKLYFKRKLHVWFRPEVLASSIGRTHTSSEVVLEAFFLSYLSFLVDNASEPVQLKYTPAGGLGTCITLTTKGVEENQAPKQLGLKVLTPAFYTRFVHYEYTSSAFLWESLNSSPDNRTCVFENAENLPLILSKIDSTTPYPAISNLGIVDHYRWRLLQKLRSAPPPGANPDSTTPMSDRASKPDDRTLRFSNLDCFVQSHFANDEKYASVVAQRLTKSTSTMLKPIQLRRVYRNIVTKVFVADTYLFGFEGLISVLDVAVRALLVVVWFKFAASDEFVHGGIGWRLCKWVAVNSLHLWDAVKNV